MVIYIILVILSVFFTWLQQVRVLKNGMKLSFFLVFLFLALRHDYGNDYSGYFINFLELETLQDDNFYIKANEVGWLYLNYFFKYLFGGVGFHLMVASMAGWICFVFYRFTTKYIPSKYYTFAVALLLLEPNNILVLSSAMRQSLAVSIFLVSFDFLLQKRYLLYTVGIFLASLFHATALYFVVLILLNVSNWRIYLQYVFIILFGLVYLLNSLTLIFDLANDLSEYQDSIYSTYTDADKDFSKYGLGYALIVFFYLSMLIINRNAYQYSPERNTIVKVVIVMLFLSVAGIANTMISRLGFYLFPIVVIAYSLTLERLDSFKLSSYSFFSKISIFIILAFFAFQNYGFWKSAVYSPYFTEYKTIFQSPLLK